MVPYDFTKITFPGRRFCLLSHFSLLLLSWEFTNTQQQDLITVTLMGASTTGRSDSLYHSSRLFSPCFDFFAVASAR
jgi:hypothetical protein